MAYHSKQLAGYYGYEADAQLPSDQYYPPGYSAAPANGIARSASAALATAAATGDFVGAGNSGLQQPHHQPLQQQQQPQQPPPQAVAKSRFSLLRLGKPPRPRSEVLNLPPGYAAYLAGASGGVGPHRCCPQRPGDDLMVQSMNEAQLGVGPVSMATGAAPLAVPEMSMYEQQQQQQASGAPSVARSASNRDRLRSLRSRISLSFSKLSLLQSDQPPQQQLQPNGSTSALHGSTLAVSQANGSGSGGPSGSGSAASAATGQEKVLTQEMRDQYIEKQKRFFKTFSMRNGLMRRHHSTGNVTSKQQPQAQPPPPPPPPPPLQQQADLPGSSAVLAAAGGGLQPSSSMRGLKQQQQQLTKKQKKANRPKSEGFFDGVDYGAGAGGGGGGLSGVGQAMRQGLSFGRSASYQKLEALGEGSYATVYKGFSHVTNSIVALKDIRLQHEEGTPFTAIREASLLKGLKHANIVTLHDIIHTENSLTFVFEYVPLDLSKYLEKHPGGLRSHNVKLFLFQLLRGLEFCHKRKILHRDLKPQNLLISAIGELKLADFGLARAQTVPSKTYSSEIVTLWYRPPEVLLGSTKYTSTLDVWAVGCIHAEMISGAPLFPGVRDAEDQLDRIFRIMGTPGESVWPGVSKLPNFTPALPRYRGCRLHKLLPRLLAILHAEDLVLSCLRLFPDERLTAAEALAHPYFEGLPASLRDLPPTVSIFSVPGVRMLPEGAQRQRLPVGQSAATAAHQHSRSTTALALK